jgi:hypothetical protein
VETLGIALVAVSCASAIALWAYGVYCYVQMVRHRVSGVSPFRVAWPPEQLTERGREFRRRALHSYAWFAALALVLLLLTGLLSTAARRANLP